MSARTECKADSIGPLSPDCPDTEINQFYQQLEDTLRSSPKKDTHIVMGDWNAKIGNDNTGFEQAMGNHGFGSQNERGLMLLEFAIKYNLYICNSRFQQKDCRKWTWTSPFGLYHNMINMSASSLRPTLHTRSNQKETESLKNNTIQHSFQTALEDKLSQLNTNTEDINKYASDIYSALNTTIEETIPTARKPRKAWISEETLILADKKRKIKNTITTSNNNRDEYRKICNEVRKAARQDKEKWLEHQCKQIEQSAQEKKSRATYQLIKDPNCKHQPRQLTIKDSNGTILQTKEEVLSRWTSYCETLYKSNLDDRSRIQELDEISPPLDDTEDLILIDEVRKAIKQLKHHKSPGTDGIVGEILQAGGGALVTHIHRLCNEAWKKEQIPEEWT
ncbi:uncharacterized protein LOC125048342 [Penaeus chinensis]|uniref:uncharacterized protein LOC125048342 n=1 Tax=Penaeus chinensis TaxID=139456 RepID=UPI001FB80C11|nr:uncharacterized protein LOC125048342 [Penaeus chinensis]